MVSNRNTYTLHEIIFDSCIRKAVLKNMICTLVAQGYRNLYLRFMSCTFMPVNVVILQAQMYSSQSPCDCVTRSGQLLWQLTEKFHQHMQEIATTSTKQKTHCSLTDATHQPALRHEHFYLSERWSVCTVTHKLPTLCHTQFFWVIRDIMEGF